MSSKKLRTWFAQNDGTRNTIQYTPNQWCKVVHGPAFVSTMIISNTNTEVDEEDLQIRIADKAGSTLILLEPKVPMPKQVSDSFRVDRLYIDKDQFLEFKPTIDGVHIYVSGVDA